MPTNTKPAQNLLIVEDNMGDARLVTEMLKDTDFKKHEIVYVQDLDALEDFAQYSFQAILLDLHLSHTKPADTFNMVNALFPGVPIVVLTGLKDDRLADRIVRLGAQDYLVKGTFDYDTLQRSLKYAIYRKKSEKKIATAKTKTRKLKSQADNFQSESIRLTKVNNAKDVFLSIASHQLRTPATAVKQYIGMLLEGYAGPMEEQQIKFLETAYRSNERQLKIVDDLLRVAKLDSGHVTLHKLPTDLRALLQEVVEDQRESLQKKNQHLVLNISRNVPLVEVDSDNIRMVFDNLLDNAIKYSNENTSIELGLEMQKKFAHFYFKDQGIGISKSDQQKLFQKFSRADKSFIHAPNGSGLGLYWAKEVVKLHGGEIHLDSTEGEGSTFTVALPMKPRYT